MRSLLVLLALFTASLSYAEKIPADEAALLRRRLGFFYGANIYTGYTFIQSSTTDYADLGGGIGFQIGWYVTQQFPVELKVGYGIMRGTDTNGNGVDLGFLETTLWGSMNFDAWQAGLGFMYARGVSAGVLPADIVATSAGDFSAMNILARAGYRMFITDMLSLTLRVVGRFGLSLNPVSMQFVGMEAAFDLNG